MLTTTRDLIHNILHPREHANNDQGSNPPPTTPGKNMLATTMGRTHNLLHSEKHASNDNGSNPQSTTPVRTCYQVQHRGGYFNGNTKNNQHYKQNREMYVTCHLLYNRLVWLKVHVIWLFVVFLYDKNNTSFSHLVLTMCDGYTFFSCC
jgi:hypothetical protein